uniref:RNA helicase n=1 Tax=Graphocephala atropunctata TaxID=36148 RepID=A0A1B6LV17_9HEMI
MVQHKAQDVSAKPRTGDIQISEDIDFKTMLLPIPIVQGLKKSGYLKPSPIQRKALPLVRCGLDLIIQAKAGTGKTCVFTVAALELVQPTLPRLQAVVLAPTREIAQQITEVITAIGQDCPGLKTCCFVGGYPLSLDTSKAVGCHIAVGAPGRMKHLIDKEILNTEHVRLFVLDEADKLMEKMFVNDINVIFSHLPESKQVLACSATYTADLMGFVSCYMYRGQYVTPEPASGANTTVLVGIRQYICVLTPHVNRLAQLRLKEKQLLHLLRSVPFNQCLVFSNLHTRAVSLCNMLRGQGWSAEWIAGRQEQADRVIALSQLKEHKVRVLVTTDLTARGIDVENVNLIINLDVPIDHHTYLHRMGRAGRYGSHGMVVTVVSSEGELDAFKRHLGAIGGTSQSVSKIPEDFINLDLWTTSEDHFEKVYGVVHSKKHSSHKKYVHKGSSKIVKPTSQKKNGKLLVEVFEDGNASKKSTDTDEKFSQESTDSDSDEDFGENVSSIGDVTVDIKEDTNKSENRTDTDEKFSQESSDDSAVIVKCDKEAVPEKNVCSCDLFKVQPTDIATEVGPSLFCATMSEEHWHKVLPVVVQESKIPLNTPLILVDCKLFRVKSMQEFGESSLAVDQNESQLISFESESCRTDDFLSFEEINSVLKSEVINLNSCPKKNNLDKILSFNEIKDFIDDCAFETTSPSGEKNENCENVRRMLTKYKKNRKELENLFKRLDCFDVVGWMAVDEKFNILEKFKNDLNEVFALMLVKCHTGRDHIKVLGTNSDCKEMEDKKSDIGQVLAFNLNTLRLTTPLSMLNIVEQLMITNKLTDKKYVCVDTNEKGDVAENGHEELKKGQREVSNLKKVVKTNKHKIEMNNSSKCSETSGSGNQYKTSSSERNLNVPYNKHYPIDDVSNRTSEESSAVYGKEKSRPISKQTLGKVKPTKAQVRHHSSLKCGTNRSFASETIGERLPVESKISQIHKRRDEIDMKSNRRVTSKPGKGICLTPLNAEQCINPCDASNRNQPHSSTGSEDSGSYIDMSQNLMKWNELHDFEESDSESSEESDVLRHSKPSKVRNSSTDSSDVSFETSQVMKQKDFHDRLAKQIKKQREKHRNITLKAEFDDGNSFKFKASSLNCFERGSEHQERRKDLVKSSHYTNGNVKRTNNSWAFELNNSSKELYKYLDGKQDEDRVHTLRNRKFVHDAQRKRSSTQNTQNKDQGHENHCYQNQTPNNGQSAKPRTLRADNLFSEWYYTWYTQVRERAQEIEMTEYINSMSTP